MMPIVKWRLGDGFAISSNTALTIAGVNSFDDRPYRPATTRGGVGQGDTPSACASASAAVTSRYSGSPVAPGSFVRSSTAMLRTVLGSAARNALQANGRYRRTFNTPT